LIGNDYLFHNIGIDSIGFHAPRYYVNIEELAINRNIDPNKFKKGLLLKEMRLPATGEDIISMGLKAGYNALTRGNINPKDIDAIFVGTETITYAVKSVSNIFAELLGISPNSLTQDIYNACAGGTLAILNAIGMIEQDIIKKALVISADISHYKIGSPSEATQGSGAIALVISKNPRIAMFSRKFGKVSGNVNDFFRPAYEEDAQAFGHYSVKTYLDFQLKAYDDLVSNIGNFYADFFTFHAPFSKLPLKCMQEIIQKRWISNIHNLLQIQKNSLKSSIFQKLDSFMQDISVLPEFIYLKLKEKGFSSSKLEKISNWLVSNVKGKVLPQLRVPMHFGNMYNAAIWAQIIYILENFAKENDTIYFGSYGSGATCISGLLKVKYGFKRVVNNGVKINDYIDHKEQKSVKEYEMMRQGVFKPEIILGKITEHIENSHRGFTLHFCDNGCIIPDIQGLNYCPKGHSGYHEKFFPLYATLKSDPIAMPENNLSYFKQDFVRISGNTNTIQKGNSLEYEIRRVEVEEEEDASVKGLLNWAPIYIPISKSEIF
jgi:3-hydroxy-3-methylglutaryl CoA synthase